MPDEAYNHYIEYRKYLQELHLESARSFDRTVYALAGGALLLSLAFVRDISPKPSMELLLAVSWFLFGFSLLSNLISTHFAERDYFHSIRAIDAAYEADEFPQGLKLTKFEEWVPRLNSWALGLFVTGVFFLIAFAAWNL